MTDKKARPAPWSDQENRAIAALYFFMLALAISGRQYNKAALVRRAQGIDEVDPRVAQIFDGQLADRSRPSIEMKLMNCSAIHRDLNGPTTVTMDGYGYRAMPNYQSSLKAALVNHQEIMVQEARRA